MSEKIRVWAPQGPKVGPLANFDEIFRFFFYQSEAGCREAATCGAPGWKRVREPSYTPTQK